MNGLLRSLGLTKQAFHQRRLRMFMEQELWAQLIPVIHHWRQDHPGESVRWLYDELKIKGLGRDKFERLCMEHGFRVGVNRNRFRTTDSLYPLAFPNLLDGLWLTGVNQVWVSDITYLHLHRDVAYITFWMDLMSRYVVGYHVSLSLRSDQTSVPALQQALAARNPPPGLILHSDGGGQYYCNQIRTLSAQYQLRNSMGRGVFENAHIERLHQTIKNQYLRYYDPRTLQDLQGLMPTVIHKYNHIKKHQSLKRITPAQYESIAKFVPQQITHKTYMEKHHILVLK
jgi:putative transposase